MSSVRELYCWFCSREIFGIRYRFDRHLLSRMLKYSFPLLILGIAGIMNQTFDKMFYPQLASNRPDAMSELGVYGAVYKIAIVMVMFTQAFRFAYEPFIFARNKDTGDGNKKSYSDAMKYFIIFGLFIFLAVMFYIDLVRFFMPETYCTGLKVVPIAMLAELFFGVFFNLSLWYKLTDRTQWGAWFSLFGFAITAIINIVGFPVSDIWLVLGGVRLLCEYDVGLFFIGQRVYPIRYDLKSPFRYTLLTVVLYAVAMVVPIESLFLRLAFRTLLLGVFLVYLFRHDLPLNEVPGLRRFVSKF